MSNKGSFNYVPKVDTNELMATSNAGIAAIRAGLDEKRAFTKEAKLSCDACRKQETSASPLQACSRCRSVRYCSRACQTAHFKTAHKRACASFEEPPLCRAFNTKVVLPGCSYPEHPVFACGVSEGMGAWISAGGTIDCRLATLPGGIKGRPEKESATVGQMMAMIPGLTPGKYLSMTVLVQNRTPGKGRPMVVVGMGIVAFASPKGTPIFMEGKEPGERSTTVDYPHLGRVLGLAKVSVQLTHFNGKAIKNPATCPAVKDVAMSAVLLNLGDYAMFTIEFRAGGPRVALDFEALELLAHVIVPAIPYDPHAVGSYAQLLPRAAARDEVCEIQARIDQDAVDAWYRDYKIKGEEAYIASHYGEARANMIGSGNQALSEMMKAMMSNMRI
ncbi:hypothetical protein B0H15DRAFT_825547 [Mycena belliarum]|uniref:MYND-type domain-containing protein n=1 Tax=Mycena belliarum TaxID=1033014 RepID=A0AAD6UGS7_9AGAR|nr:hypothetical protein B0H15DRAFT_825547 [Mycena belliae]